MKRILSTDLLEETTYESRGEKRYIKKIDGGRLWYRSGKTGLIIECKVWQFLEWVNAK